MNPIQSEVRNFVAENFLFGEDPESLQNDDSFLETGIIDSTGVLELVAFIEDQYHVEVDDDRLQNQRTGLISKERAVVITIISGTERQSSS
jgi:acyl carrier protein